MSTDTLRLPWAVYATDVVPNVLVAAFSESHHAAAWWAQNVPEGGKVVHLAEPIVNKRKSRKAG